MFQHDARVFGYNKDTGQSSKGCILDGDIPGMRLKFYRRANTEANEGSVAEALKMRRALCGSWWTL